jgi:hypothetical protein
MHHLICQNKGFGKSIPFNLLDTHRLQSDDIQNLDLFRLINQQGNPNHWSYCISKEKTIKTDKQSRESKYISLGTAQSSVIEREITCSHHSFASFAGNRVAKITKTDNFLFAIAQLILKGYLQWS